MSELKRIKEVGKYYYDESSGIIDYVISETKEMYTLVDIPGHHTPWKPYDISPPEHIEDDTLIVSAKFLKLKGFPTYEKKDTKKKSKKQAR